MRSHQIENVLRTMESCRIRRGRITARAGDRPPVDAVPLALVDDTRIPGEPRTIANDTL